MLLRLDHLVVAVENPVAAAAELEQRVGLICTGGGAHPLWGTHNRLAWLGDTYVELIGVADPALAPNGAVSRAVLAALDAGRPGLVTYAVATDDADADLGRLRATGSNLSDVEVRSRTRPDGEVVRWRAAFPPTLDPSRPPFIVEHEAVGAEWGPAARAERANLRHPLGGPARVQALVIPVPDVAATVAAYRRTLGLAFSGEPPVAKIEEQAVSLVPDGPGIEPATVEITTSNAEPRDVEAVGVRWRVTRSAGA